MKTTGRFWTRWAPLLVLTAILAGCGPAVTPTDAPAPTPAPTPTPAEPQATCGDSAIRLLGHGAGIHGAIVADTLHMGGVEAPVTCADPANLSLEADLSIPDDYTAQVQQSQYYLIVINYPGGNRLYVISRRADGSTCIVDTNDRCIAQVTELPDDFDLQDLPEDVQPTIPAGRPAPELPAAPGAAGNPQPRDGATGVAVETLLLSWSAAAQADSYEVYWGATENLAADADLGTPIATTSTATTIRRPALGTTYYWRVDTKNDLGTTTGSVWSFTTADQAAPAPPGGGGYTPPAVSPPPAEEPPPAAPVAAGNPQPRHGATGVAVETVLLSWSAVARAASYDVYWGTTESLAADADLGTPIATTFTATTIRRPALGTTYYWRVDAKNGQGTTTGNVWSFTTAAQATPPPVAPGGGYTPPVAPEPSPPEPSPPEPSPPEPLVGAAASPQWSDEAKRIRITTYAHQPINVSVPWPSGNPRPEVTKTPSADGSGANYKFPDYIRLKLSESHITLTGDSNRYAESGTIDLLARNSEGSAKLSIPFTVSCGYSMQDAIDMWVGTHPLSSPPAGWAPNETFNGNTSITITSTGVTYRDVHGTATVRFRTGGFDYTTWDESSRIICGSALEGSSGFLGPHRAYVYFELDYVEDNDGHNIYKNLHKGGSSPACGTRWFDARVRFKTRRGYGWQAEYYYSDTAQIDHSACD